MSGLDKSSKRKHRMRSVDMSEGQEDAGPSWRKPARDECEEETYDSQLQDADLRDHKLIIRMVRHRVTYELVEFSLIQMTRVHSHWVEVAEIDSCHDVDIHLHQCGKDAGGRVSEPVVLADIESVDDVEAGYGIALERMEDEWEKHLDRWQYG